MQINALSISIHTETHQVVNAGHRLLEKVELLHLLKLLNCQLLQVNWLVIYILIEGWQYFILMVI